MGWRPYPNCQHADNWGRCRVHTLPRWIRWAAPKGRPKCILLTEDLPQDGAVTCPDKLPYPRPAPPAPPAKND